MGKPQLTLAETKEVVLHCCQRMEESKDLLTQADKAIGDGDHGVGMARGFEAVRQKVASQEFSALNQLFETVGTTLLTSVGGAAGAIFGTLFRGGVRNLGDRQVFDSAALAAMLSDGLQAVQARGQATAGDKTMVDALQPAALKADELSSAPLDETLVSVTEAARQGMEQTKDMVARIGKAKTLGERSLGHPDPGALSTYLLLKYMMEYVTESG